MNCILMGQKRMPKAMMRLKIEVPMALHALLLRWYTQGSSRLFSVVSKKTKNLSKGTFIHKKKLLPYGVTEHCTRLPREGVESPFLDVFKSQLDMAPSNLLWLTLL